MELHGMPDDALVDRAKSAPEGDLRAFEELVVRHQDRVQTNCRYLTRSTSDSEDLAQEVFVKAFYGLPRFEGRSAFSTWIQRIKVNHCLNWLKKNEGRIHVDIEDPALQQNPKVHVQPDAEVRASASGERRAIAEILDDMSDTLRVPLLMCDMDGMPYQEIADTLGIRLSAVKMRIKRAREEFRRIWREREEQTAVPPS